MALNTIAVDFDGVIHKYSEGWKDGSIYDGPMDDAIDGLERLMDRYAVFIFTARDTDQVAEWLERFDFDTQIDEDDPPDFWNTKGILLVTNHKLPAIAYIDDRAYLFSNWTNVINDFVR